VRALATSNPHKSLPASRTAAGRKIGRGVSFASIVFSSLIVALVAFEPWAGTALADATGTLAAGSKLYVRLEVAASTRTSHLNQAVNARVVREVTCDQGLLVPIGAEVTGKIVKLIPTSDPTDHARMLIRFDQLAVPHQTAVPLTAHLIEVENARETVLPDGTIQGVLEKDAAVGRVDGLLDKLGSAGEKMEEMSGKAVGKVDTAIDFPVGTDMVLTLDQPLALSVTALPASAGQLSAGLTDAIQKLLVEAPNRVESRTKKPGDPLNLVVVGTAQQILSAFKDAGWSEAKKLGARSAVGTVKAMANDQGYGQAPVSQLYLFGRVEDLAFEKMLDTFLKRHHLRLWRSDVTGADGREIWLGASTHDIGLDVHPGVISHETDPDLDAERAKVGADLMAGGWVAAERLVSRPNPLSEGKTATGGTWKTDGQLLVIELKTSGTI
jgi:hypothetical protein